jgi:gliding motility-associated-like protein
MTNTQGATCSATYTIYSRDPEVLVTAEKDTSICPGGCVELDATAKVIKSPAKVITYSNNEFQAIASTFGSITSININVQGINSSTVQPGLIQSVCIDNLTFFGANIFPPGQVGIEALELALVCPDGTRIVLVPAGVTSGTQTSGYANTCFVPVGGTNISTGTNPYTGNYDPNEPFSNLNGCTSNGLWKLEVRMASAAGFGFGTFFGWNITFDDPEISYPAEFTWSPTTAMTGETTLNPTVCPTSATTYIITASDTAGCMSRDAQVTISIDPTCCDIQFTANALSPNCNQQDGSITLDITVGSGNYNFEWSNGATIKDISGLAPGVYTVTVSDLTQNCDKVSSVTVFVPDKPEINLDTIINVACNGAESGAVIVTVTGGTAPYVYNWSDESTDETFTNVEAGNYSLTVFDENLCSDTLDFVINQPDVLLAEGSQTDILCFGDSTGTVEVVILGGTLPYTLEWSNGATTENLENLVSDVYSVTITDANGCEIDLGFELDQPAELEFETTVTSAECGESNGGVVVNLIGGGVPNYIFEWSNGNSPDLENVSVGFYSVTLTDGNGCTVERTVYVPNLNAPEVILDSLANVTCNGGNNGFALVSVSAGVTPYTFEWTNSSSVDTFAENLSAGNYIFQVTDAEGCISLLSVDISEPAALAISTTTSNTQCEQTNGSIAVTITGGTEPYEYLWSNGNTTEDISGLPADDYTLTVTDANGCELVSQALTIGIDGTLPKPNITVDGAIPFCEGGSVILTSDNTTGNIWSNGETTQSITVTDAGDYSLYISRNDCESEVSDIVMVTVTPIPDAPVITANGPLTFCEGESVVLTSNYVTGNTWNTNETSQNITVTQDGSYTVSAVVNGCPSPASEPVMVVVNEIPEAIITAEENEVCAGGSLVLQTTLLADSYLWSDGTTNQTTTVTSAGTYSVTVTTAGCSDETEITIGSKALPNVDLGTDTTLCDGETLTLNTFNANIESYNWSNGATVSDIEVVESGLVSVTVTNECGNASDEILVTFEGCACKLMAPDAFTPDGDGKNDLFVPSYDCSISNYIIRIYNRWGQLVFESNNPNAGWDGTFEGRDQPIGTYVYYIEYVGFEGSTSEKRIEKGGLTLVR